MSNLNLNLNFYNIYCIYLLSFLQFCMNEFGIMEVVEEDETSKQNKNGNIGDKENVCLMQNSSKSSPVMTNNAINEKKGKSDLVTGKGV